MAIWLFIWAMAVGALQAREVVTFERLGDLPGDVFWSEPHDVSADGSVVVGYGWADSWRPSAIRWEDGQMERITGMGQAYSVSSDGMVVAGFSEYIDKDNPDVKGIVWEAGTFTLIDNIMPGNVRFEPVSISGDGYRVLGTVGQSGYLWEDGSLTLLVASPDGGGLDVQAISEDGKVVVGHYTDTKPVNATSTPFVLRNSALSALPLFPQDNEGEALGANYDGSVIVGGSFYRSPSGHVTEQACRWVDGVIMELESLYEPDGVSCALDVCGNGKIIIGISGPDTNIDWEAVIWSEENGWVPITFKQFLVDLGISISTNITLDAISSDGTTFVGQVSKGGGQGKEAFRLQILDLFGQHRITEGIAETGDWLGRVHAAHDPWIWCEGVPCWLHIPEETADAEQGWVYPPNPDTLQIVQIDGSNWGYSFTLNKWLYLTASGWVYLIE